MSRLYTARASVADIAPLQRGVMRGANEAMLAVHTHIPVLLMPDEYETWLHGSFDEALALQERVFPSELIEITPTDELWAKRKPKDAGASLI